MHPFSCAFRFLAGWVFFQIFGVLFLGRQGFQEKKWDHSWGHACDFGEAGTDYGVVVSKVDWKVALDELQISSLCHSVGLRHKVCCFFPHLSGTYIYGSWQCLILSLSVNFLSFFSLNSWLGLVHVSISSYALCWLI